MDEAWGSPVGGLRPELLSDVSLSAQRFSAFNLQILQYTVHFLFVAADERGPGGMKQITGVEDWEKGAVGWPSTSMYKRRKSKLIVWDR